jgi:uncharacterized protein (TIGR03118 family)
MGRTIRDLQHRLCRRWSERERRLSERRPNVETLEERALLSAAPDLSALGLHAARLAKKMVPEYQQTNLVSDGAVSAQLTDSALKNPWGMAFSGTGPFWISDAGSGMATIYTVSSSGTVTKASLAPTIPGGGPTGQVFNSTASSSSPSFMLPGPNNTKVPASFIFDTLQGTIAGWASKSTGGTSAAVSVANQSGAEFTGLALDSNAGQNLLYAANGGSSPGITVYNSSFTPVTLTGNFVDPKLSKESFAKKFVPYNIQNIGGELFVTYRGSSSLFAKGGAVAEFNPDGTFVRQIASNAPSGNLQAPWGVAVAPANFGGFSNDLLVGNFANGRINAFNPTNGKFLGQLDGTNRKPLADPGLWAISVGNGGSAGSMSTLYFTAGINGEADGLLGAITPVTT